MHIHIVAVAGSGMGSLAGLLRQLGHEVSGSDVSFDPPMGPALKAWGVTIKRGFSPENLQPTPDLVVVGNVCRESNVEVAAARELGLELTHIAGALQRFVFGGTSVLVVAGTHGKTTTTALTAYLLDRAGLKPGFLIGGIPKDLAQSFQKPAVVSERSLLAFARAGRKPPFVIEGDEYDTAYFEKTAKFLHYCADVATITSIEYDHVDIYPSFEDYVAAFARFIRQIPASGLIIANAADRTLVDLVQRNAQCEVSYYALEGEDCHGVAPHWLAAVSESGATGTSFDVFAGGVQCGRFAVPLSGRHNVANSVAALAACAQGYGVRLEALLRPLASFAGVKRRQELLASPGGVHVYDDFAHHPTAVAKTLSAFRARHRVGRLIVLFEPRSATACRNLHQADYVRAFAAADAVLLAPLGRAGLAEGERLDTSKLARDLRSADRHAEAHTEIDSMVDWVEKSVEPGDVVAVLSNGAFGQVHEKLLGRLKARFSQYPGSFFLRKPRQSALDRGVTCPCGKGESLETCCGPYLNKTAVPETPEALMRSRYSAFATGDIDYIFETHDPDTVHQVDRRSTEVWSQQSEWLGLEVLDTDLGGPSDYTGTVEFVAKYKVRGATINHREVATFRKHNGRWLFVDGEEVAGPPVVREGPRVGRNDPCPCGSGKKFKKCCGKAA